ncbi:ribosomal protection-like ABC-F family protein [Rhizosphaericola mali]|uniref:ABC-F family ATP-binding cassette domain-containing protein n=1 Tax=Rhizosphaericola mali TaxID=2545455 RepID=A0A5P2G5N1_9BACT|nr:ABC-F family ATP-binding cassette domain-containing protein [Rhizosphaericola mali]QES88423.1 ABC-F family ATP-binding cassette domain-containing protein [Rhizosphaericola mali]
MLYLQNVSYTFPNKHLLFSGLNLSIKKGEKIALVGNNGVGKSTLLQLITRQIIPSEGQIFCNAKLYTVPQHFGQLNDLSIEDALQISSKLKALHAILDGDASVENYDALADDWDIEHRVLEALQDWHLPELDLTKKLSSLSGGQKTKLFLAGIKIHQPDLVIMDEPSNHLDSTSREQLYQYISHTNQTLIVVSHDRTLLNLLLKICELTPTGIKLYGGNYQFFKEQKALELTALSEDVLEKEKAIRKAKDKERETSERQQKLDARGKGKQAKSGVARIMMNTLRNSAENSTAKLKDTHAQKIGGLQSELKDLRAGIPALDQMKFQFDYSNLHKGKTLVRALNINYSFGTKKLWSNPLNFEILSGERIAITGNNGSGKTTLIQLILGKLQACEGEIFRFYNAIIYIDQDYSVLQNQLSVFQQAESFNSGHLEGHEIKIRLNRFLFHKDDWDKTCAQLSGGERMRLLLCCLTIQRNAPDIIILDEPTNNLDIQNVDILTAAIKDYQGTLIVISHDEVFKKEIGIHRNIQL